ncbi:hypothetical protein MMC13_003330 [Lambiella insularis]|nr:hypothetical protein [Lambiella insularis]
MSAVRRIRLKAQILDEKLVVGTVAPHAENSTLAIAVPAQREDLPLSKLVALIEAEFEVIHWEKGPLKIRYLQDEYGAGLNLRRCVGDYYTEKDGTVYAVREASAIQNCDRSATIAPEPRSLKHPRGDPRPLAAADDTYGSRYAGSGYGNKRQRLDYDSVEVMCGPDQPMRSRERDSQDLVADSVVVADSQRSPKHSQPHTRGTYGSPISLPTSGGLGVPRHDPTRTVANSTPNSPDPRGEVSIDAGFQGGPNSSHESLKSESPDTDSVPNINLSNLKTPATPVQLETSLDPELFRKPSLPFAQFTASADAGEKEDSSIEKGFAYDYNLPHEPRGTSIGSNRNTSFERVATRKTTSDHGNSSSVRKKAHKDVWDVNTSDSEGPSTAGLLPSTKKTKYQTSAHADTVLTRRTFSEIDGPSARPSSTDRRSIVKAGPRCGSTVDSAASEGLSAYPSASKTPDLALDNTPFRGISGLSSRQLMSKRGRLDLLMEPDNQYCEEAGNMRDDPKSASRQSSHAGIPITETLLKRQPGMSAEKRIGDPRIQGQGKRISIESNNLDECVDLAGRPFAGTSLPKTTPSLGEENQSVARVRSEDVEQRKRQESKSESRNRSEVANKQAVADHLPKRTQKEKLEKKEGDLHAREMGEQPKESLELTRKGTRNGMKHKLQSITPPIPGRKVLKTPSMRSSSMSMGGTPSRGANPIAQEDILVSRGSPPVMSVSSIANSNNGWEPGAGEKQLEAGISVGETKSVPFKSGSNPKTCRATVKSSAVPAKGSNRPSLAEFRALVKESKKKREKESEKKREKEREKEFEKTKRDTIQLKLAFEKVKGKQAVYSPSKKQALPETPSEEPGDSRISANGALPQIENDPGPSRRRSTPNILSLQGETNPNIKSWSPPKVASKAASTLGIKRNTDEEQQQVIKQPTTPERYPSKSMSRSPAKEVASSATTSSDAESGSRNGSESGSESGSEIDQDESIIDGIDQGNTAAYETAKQPTQPVSTTRESSDVTTESDSENESVNGLPRSKSQLPLASPKAANFETPGSYHSILSSRESSSRESSSENNIVDPVQRQVQRDFRESMEPSRSSQLGQALKTPKVSRSCGNGPNKPETQMTSTPPPSSRSSFPSFKKLMKTAAANPPLEQSCKSTANAKMGPAISKTEVPSVHSTSDSGEDEDDDDDSDSDTNIKSGGKQAGSIKTLLKRK